MPLPDAKPDRRIYELLKTTDLENLTFSNFQKVAQTIYAEQGAEDELRRIVLVNLARLTVAGEWSGLTSAGGASTQLYPAGTGTYGTSGRFNLHKCNPFFMSGSYGDYNFASLTNKATFYPFLAFKSGDVSEIGMQIQSASSGHNMLVGIYTTGTNGLPATLLGSGSISLSSTGDAYQTSFSATITLEQGKQYFIGYVPDSNFVGGSYRAPTPAGVGFFFPTINAVDDDAQRGLSFTGEGSARALDASYTGGSMYATNSAGQTPCFTVAIG